MRNAAASQNAIKHAHEYRDIHVILSWYLWMSTLRLFPYNQIASFEYLYLNVFGSFGVAIPAFSSFCSHGLFVSVSCTSDFRFVYVIFHIYFGSCVFFTEVCFIYQVHFNVLCLLNWLDSVIVWVAIIQNGIFLNLEIGRRSVKWIAFTKNTHSLLFFQLVSTINSFLVEKLAKLFYCHLFRSRS